jgi:hypothetical protein
VTISPGVLLVLAIAMLAVPAATTSFAQATAPPQGSPNQNAREALDVTLSVTAAYNSDVSTAAPTAAVNQLLGPDSIARSNQFHGNANYRWAADDLQVIASGTTAWLHDPQRGAVGGLGHTGAAGLTARLPRRTTLLVNQTATYSPSQLYNLFPRAAATGPGEAPPAAPDYGANDFGSYSYATQATLTHDVTRRSSVSVSATADRTLTDHRGTTAGQSELGSYGMSGRLTRLLSRGTRATGRYFYRAGSFPDASLATATAITPAHGVVITEHGVEFGMVHTRPVSATRQIVFDVALGGGVVTPVEQRAGPVPFIPSSRMIGQVTTAYLFARTWQAGATYRRGVDYVPGLSEPVFTDGFTARIGGSFSRAVEAVVMVAYTSGASALTRGSPAFDTYTSNARLRVALTRAVSVYAEYLYYLYDFRRQAGLVPGMVPALERNGIRIGLTLVVPTLGR